MWGFVSLSLSLSLSLSFSLSLSHCVRVRLFAYLCMYCSPSCLHTRGDRRYY